MDHIELAWAAGFFDGEGTVYYNAYKTKGKPHRGIELSVCQNAINPYVIERFHKATLGIGTVTIYPNKCGHLMKCRVATFEKVQAIVALLWKYLSPVKREQAREALSLYLEHPTRFKKAYRKRMQGEEPESFENWMKER